MCQTQTTKRGIYVAKTLENRKLCDEHFLIRLGLGRDFPPARPGQFVQLQCRGLGEQASNIPNEWPLGGLPRLTQPELVGKEPMLRRPLSIADFSATAAGAELTVIYRTIGTGTSWLGGLDAGTELSVLGPLGNGFTIQPGKKQAVLIGGGVGIPPMLYLAKALSAAGKSVVAFSGVRSERLLPLSVRAGSKPSPAGAPMMCIEQFARLGASSVVASDDGSIGFGGTVTEAFRNYLNAHLPAVDDLVVYSCGPEPMMRSAAELCLSRGYECQLALERHMACGMGTCQSCIVKIRDANERGWSFKLCCTDGPVFDARNILW